MHFGRFGGLPDPSPFCCKVEAYLRMTEVEYKRVPSLPHSAPRKQLPYIDDSGKKVADSTEIINYLRETRGDRFNDWLTSEQKNRAFLLQKATEEYFYFLLLYQRWILPGNFAVVKKGFFRKLPAPAKLIVPNLVRFGARQRLEKQGLGRISADDNERLSREFVDVLAETLGDQDYFLGARPCWLDASMFGFLVNVLASDFPEGVGAYARKKENLSSYVGRFMSLYFEDLMSRA